GRVESTARRSDAHMVRPFLSMISAGQPARTVTWSTTGSSTRWVKTYEDRAYGHASAPMAEQPFLRRSAHHDCADGDEVPVVVGSVSSSAGGRSGSRPLCSSAMNPARLVAA